jgi:formylmethanofuran--tetrahydromethanopterin N-formyltransferase
MTAAMEATGFATSAIGCPCEAGIEGYVSADETPDGRPGVSILICASKKKVPEQVMERIAECVLTAATTSVFNGMPDAEEKFDIKIHFFGDKFESKVEIGDGSAGRSRLWKETMLEKKSLAWSRVSQAGTSLSWQTTR